MSNEIEGINTTGMDAQTIALIRQYAGSSQAHPQQDFQLSQNGRNRAQEMIKQAGLTREQAQQDPAMLKAATLRALAEQRGQLPANEGINGRNGLGSSTRGVKVGRSLSDMATPSSTKD